MAENPTYRAGFGLLVFACAAASYYSREGPAKRVLAAKGATDSNNDLHSPTDPELPSPVSAEKELVEFEGFKRNYLLVYALVMTADWLQGPSTYPLYKFYGYDLAEIAILFVVGFLSSAIFGTLIGSFADKAGRKLACLVFCAIYSLSCLTKLSPNFTVLLFGRLLGGISTSLLFSVFEAWMVSEHHSRGFREVLLSDTFSWSTFLNGLVAIMSGILANFVSESYGFVAPFMASMFFLIIAAVVVQSTWKENYGSNKPSDTNESGKSSIREAARAIWKDPAILAVGVMQCFFESAMYSFVFLWAPVLEHASASGNIPFGLVFAAFMVSIMIGSVVFKVMLRNGYKHEDIARVTFGVATLALVIPIIAKDEVTLFIAFNLFELCCGLYFPSLGTLRSKVVPEETRSTIMNVFRVPLNLIVVGVLLKVDAVASSTVFGVCAALLGVGFLFANRLRARLADEAAKPARHMPLDNIGGH
ncbi:Molybdate-anion transporter [Geranomyces michiganensis]|nr:Molybdate-anion transporter [Geranomyces michiganensis]